MSRRFAPVTSYTPGPAVMPVRKTGRSAGYDLAAAEEMELSPHRVTLIPTGLKAYMEADEVLLVTIRSSVATKLGLLLANGVGVIDADYVDNPSNEGHIYVALLNPTDQTVRVDRGQTIAQGLFTRFLLVEDDQTEGKRTGGFGSTDRQV